MGSITYTTGVRTLTHEAPDTKLRAMFRNYAVYHGFASPDDTPALQDRQGFAGMIRNTKDIAARQIQMVAAAAADTSEVDVGEAPDEPVEPAPQAAEEMPAPSVEPEP